MSWPKLEGKFTFCLEVILTICLNLNRKNNIVLKYLCQSNTILLRQRCT